MILYADGLFLRRTFADQIADDHQPGGDPDPRFAIDGLKRWHIRRWLVLGHFAFGRFLMYIDLKPENWRDYPAGHPLVNAILSGSESGDDEPLRPAMPDDYPIDEPEIEKIAPLLIQDADASQHSALIDMMRERNLVIQGPPGTGKSQTIANMIANAVAAGKRVLFLAEKQAALDVVKRRLDRAGIGDFCLELHSDKASPKFVVERPNLSKLDICGGAERTLENLPKPASGRPPGLRVMSSFDKFCWPILRVRGGPRAYRLRDGNRS